MSLRRSVSHGVRRGDHQDILAALEAEIQEFAECGGNPITIAKSRHNKAQAKIDELRFMEIVRRRARYSTDDDDDLLNSW